MRVDWHCLTCTRTGSGDAPQRCPSCDSERDDRHGPHSLIEVVGPARFHFPVGIDAGTRAALIRKARAIRPARNRPPHNYARARKLAEDQATVRLTAPEPYPGHKGTGLGWMVRVYYRSRGDEILCFDAGPMSASSANRMVREYDLSTSMSALGTQRWRTDAHIPPIWKGSRHVVLPSQHAEPVQIVATDPEPLLHLVPTPEPTSAPPPAPEREIGSAWRAAVARRQSRVLAWRRAA